MTHHIRQKICIITSLFLVLSTVLCACSYSKLPIINKSDFVLNTVATISLYKGGDEALIDECFDLCKKYESLLSRTDKNSEIYRLNNREISDVSSETAQLIAESLHYSEISNGAFDVTIEPLSSLWNFSSETPHVPSPEAVAQAQEKVGYKDIIVSGNNVSFSNDYTRIDLGAIAKGYIADRMKDFLVSRGVESAIINLGGNVLCIGGKTSTEGFTIGIQNPFKDNTIASVSLSNLSVVTSGTYERYFEEDGVLYHHILDPKTGYPVDNDLLSVSIIGPNSSNCDALSTSCFALGKDEGMKLVEGMEGYYAIFITDDYKLHFSKGAEKALSIKY